MVAKFNLQKENMKLSKIHRKMILAFALKRRKSMILVFENNFWGRMKFSIIRTVFRKNIHFHSFWNKSRTHSKTQIFLFRKIENLEKYIEAESLSWRDNKREKSILLGEALNYPKFVIQDFVEMLNEENSQKMSFKNFDFGYDGFVFRAENFRKVLDWLKSQEVPLEKSHFRVFENGKWRDLLRDEIEGIKYEN